jgi:hypothetical protein
MRISKLPAAAIGLALSASPVFAQAERAASQLADTNSFGGDSTLLLILAAVLVGIGIYILATNEDDTPSSP